MRRPEGDASEAGPDEVPSLECASDDRESWRKAREKALDLLSRREHSVEELRRKLLQRGLLEESVTEVVEGLQAQGYLDDLRFAESFVRFRRTKLWGRWRFLQELSARGVSGPSVSRIVEALLGEVDDVREQRLVRFYRDKLLQGRTPLQIAAALQRRGYERSELLRLHSEQFGPEEL